MQLGVTFYDKILIETFGHDGTNNYMNHNLDMKGKSLTTATQLSALTYVDTPTIRTTNIEFWDVATTGDTDLIIKNRFNQFHEF